MKEYAKQLLTQLLWKQVKRLRKKNKLLVIAVAGSIGKTGTKRAIATVLSQQMKVQWQDGNYNELISIPLVFFGQTMPHIFNPFGWARVFISSEQQIRGNYPYTAVVVEVGAGAPGTFKEVGAYLRADYGVLTAVAPEHMENFHNLDRVAKEELQIADIADTVLVDQDAVNKKYLERLGQMTDPLTYGQGVSDCRYTPKQLTDNLRRQVTFTLKDNRSFMVNTALIGKQGLPGLAAAVLLADILELTKEEITRGLRKVQPFAGRMQLLKGMNGSLIIDDTYNASPEAVRAALDTLYELKAPQKIAILGQMNELGKHSKKLHTEIGEYCDPKQLELVVTIGDDANKYLAPAAAKRGCKIMRCPSPQHAADVVGITLKKGGIVLAKGSQNSVFAEEAIKELLADPDDSKKLVRQSRSWLRLKERQFLQ